MKKSQTTTNHNSQQVSINNTYHSVQQQPQKSLLQQRYGNLQKPFQVRHSRQPSPLVNEYTPAQVAQNHNKSFNTLLGQSAQNSFRHGGEARTKKKDAATQHQTNFQKNTQFKELSQSLIPRNRPFSSQAINQQQHEPTQNSNSNEANKYHRQPLSKGPIVPGQSGSNLSTMRNANNYMSFINNHQKHSPSTVKMSDNFKSTSPSQHHNSSINQQFNQDLSMITGPGGNTLQDISNYASTQNNNNNNNYSAFIFRSGEKQKSNNKPSLSSQKLKENMQKDYLSQQPISVQNNIGQRLEEIEQDAQALKRSMLESSHLTNSGFQSFLDQKSMDTNQREYKNCKKQLQKVTAKYQQLIKEHSTLQHDSALKDLQLQRLLKETNEFKEEIGSKDYKIKQLRYENERLFNECSTLKNIQTMTNTTLAANSFLLQDSNLEVESENLRKKVKRLTGEIDVMETYFNSLQTLLKQTITNPESLQSLQKVFRSLQDSLDYSKELFTQTKFNVTQGKRVQRKIRYEKLKTEFQQLILQMTQSQSIIVAEQKDKSSERQRIQQDFQQMDKDKKELQKRVEQYKEQVNRMRENIELFKQNMKVLKNQNDELQAKLKSQNAPNSDSNQVQALFQCLKEDNERLAQEIKKLQDENTQLKHYLGVSKETIHQQNGIIQGLQSVIDNHQKSQTVNFLPVLDMSSRNDNGNFLATTNKNLGVKISSTISDSARNNISSIQERSKSCGSNVDQNQANYSKKKPVFMHQNIVLQPQLVKQNLNMISNDYNDIQSNPLSPDYSHYQSQQVQPLQRSYSNLSIQSSNPINKQFLQSQNQAFYKFPNEIFKANALNQTSNGILNDQSYIVSQQDQSYFNDSFIRYLAADQKLNNTNFQALKENQLDMSSQHIQSITPNTQILQGILEGGYSSPMTARFSSFQTQLQKQKLLMSNVDMSRQNIKENTKNLIGEIQGIDDEIYALQGTLINTYLNQNSNASQILAEQQMFQPLQEDYEDNNLQVNFQNEGANNISGVVQRTIDFENNINSNNNANDFSLIDEYIREDNEDNSQH